MHKYAIMQLKYAQILHKYAFLTHTYANIHAYKIINFFVNYGYKTN